MNSPHFDASPASTDGPGANVQCLAEGGVTGALVRSFDWSTTPLGGIETWPRSLVSAVGMVLHSRHPMFLWWGPELIQFYNDAYLPSFGEGKHPAAMGQAGRASWPEIWPIISPQIDAVMTQAQASWHEDALVPIHRNGRIEEVYWTYGYSPVFAENGQVGGTLVVCTETTARVVGARRTEFLRTLGDRLSVCGEIDELMAVTRDLCAGAKLDIPFLLGYRQRASGEWSLGGATELPAGALASLDRVVRPVLDGHAGARPSAPRQVVVEVSLEGAAWPEPTRLAVILAPTARGTDTLVFGVSPRLAFDAAYATFLGQIVEQIDLAASRLEIFRVRAVVEGERRNLLLQAPFATALLTGPRHLFELANPRYREMVGRDVIGKEYLDAFPEIAGTPLAAIVDRVYREGEPFLANELSVLLDARGDGKLEEHFFRFNLEPTRDADGSVYGMMAMAMDITEQVLARKALEKTTMEREKLLAQLEAANHAKDEFLATVSHELRTPLTSILGWTHILAESSEPARLQKGLAVIERNAKAQARLIEDILDISRIISGKVRMNMRPVDPVAVVRAAIEVIRPLAVAKKIQIADQIEAVPPLNADEERLQQTVWNLLSNAVKFTPPGGEIAVRLRLEGGWVVITVQDNGKGISPDFLPHVFDRFRQHDNSTTKFQAGLGLGLAIVRHLVELHGGRVTARSEGEGHGAVFELSLPLRSAPTLDESPTPTRSAERVHSTHAAEQRLTGLHVLLVDDQADARELLATVLEDAGARVTQADSAPEALRALTSAAFALLVSDIGMPGEDGYSLIQKVRRSDVAQTLPAIALTAFARPEDRQRALAAGFQEHVAKPIEPVRLVDLVATLARR
jgi:signal transduction histidine kinase/CheY-like chemotaxis protein